MRRAAKVDANQPAIVAAVRAMGATVQPLHAVGQGCPDILVGWKNRNYLWEIKDGDKPPSHRKLTPDQEKWHRDWRGSVYVVESVGQAVALLIALGEENDIQDRKRHSSSQP